MVSTMSDGWKFEQVNDSCISFVCRVVVQASVVRPLTFTHLIQNNAFNPVGVQLDRNFIVNIIDLVTLKILVLM